MSSNIRVPEEIYLALRQMRIELESEYHAAAPSFQDFARVAMTQLIEDWKDPKLKEKFLNQLLERRQKARSRMGNRSPLPEN